jgi:signal transduction histidine kinase
MNGRYVAIRKLFHDLRNPISGILSASQYLIEDAGPSLDPHQRALLASIEASGIRLLRLIEDFERSGKHSGKPAGSKEKPRRPYQSPVS